jgi:hypothetical protein
MTKKVVQIRPDDCEPSGSADVADATILTEHDGDPFIKEHCV